ncbi:MAG: hypothetical protein HQL37_07910 [Alphaproteobacteria bacterium]|nr:hypothetical protein [Alphaproteobacteria bacterium]
MKFTKFGVANDTAAVLKNMSNFKMVMNQINQAVNDASYSGKNLLLGNATMNVIFNEDGSSHLNVQGNNMTYDGDLGFSNITQVDWTRSGSIQQAIDQATKATTTLRTVAASFGASQSIIQARSDFANSMIATLHDGADSLTLADMNELAANSLALSTQR